MYDLQIIIMDLCNLMCRGSTVCQVCQYAGMPGMPGSRLVYAASICTYYYGFIKGSKCKTGSDSRLAGVIISVTSIN